MTIASEALGEVMAHLDKPVPAPKPQSTSPLNSHKAISSEAKRMHLVKSHFGDMTVVDKEKINDIQGDVERAIKSSLRYRNKLVAAKAELEQYKKGTVRHVETAVAERMKEKFIQIWTVASNFHNSSFLQSQNAMSDHAAFMKKDHEEMVATVSGCLRQHNKYLSEQTKKINSAVKVTVEKNEALSTSLDRLQLEYEEKCRSSEKFENEAELQRKEIVSLHKDLEGAIESARGFQNKIEGMKRQVMEDFDKELRGGFVLKKHARRKKKVQLKVFNMVTDDGADLIIWNDGKKSFSLVGVGCRVEKDNRCCFTMTNASGETLTLEAENETSCSLFVSKLNGKFNA